jgi:predicted transcriptional regulator
MSKPSVEPPKPTNAELGILRRLWDLGPSTVREVQVSLERDRPVGYTTVLKLLQIMAEKGLVTRDESSRKHVYAPAVSEETTQQHLVSDLIDRAFGGSAMGLVMQALSDNPASTEELRKVRELIDQLNGGAE